MNDDRFRHEFVELMPEVLDPETLYVSIEHAIVIHLCACGCGERVVTPLSPAEWRLTFDGETVSLYPSIGNWSFDCQSHYWLDRNRVMWGKPFSKETIERIRADGADALVYYYDGGADEDSADRDAELRGPPQRSRRSSWARLARWWRG